MLVYYSASPTLTWLWVIPIFIVQVALSLGLMFFLAPLNAMYRDVGQAVPLVVQVWMYATPIMYPASLVPQSVRPYYFLNPMAAIVEGYRSAMLRNETPDLGFLACATVIAFAALGRRIRASLSGWRSRSRTSPDLPERMADFEDFSSRHTHANLV